MPKPGTTLRTVTVRMLAPIGAIVVVIAANPRGAAAQPGATAPDQGMPAPDRDMPAPDQGMPPPDQGMQAPYPDPAQAQQPPTGQPPPNSTAATFLSTTSQPWEVLVDRTPACATPCSIYVPPMRFVTLRSIERSPVLLDVGYLPTGSVVVQGTPLAQGKYAGGIVGTTFSGMGLAAGITLAAVGCSTDRRGMCNAGLITGGASAIGLYLSIQLMRSALPKVRIGPAQPYATGNTVGVAGSF